MAYCTAHAIHVIFNSAELHILEFTSSGHKFQSVKVVCCRNQGALKLKGNLAGRRGARSCCLDNAKTNQGVLSLKTTSHHQMVHHEG